MNNVFLQERLVELKLREVERELEQVRLLKETGFSSPNLLARVAQALRHLPNAWSKSFHGSILRSLRLRKISVRSKSVDS